MQCSWNFLVIISSSLAGIRHIATHMFDVLVALTRYSITAYPKTTEDIFSAAAVRHHLYYRNSIFKMYYYHHFAFK